MMFLQSLILSTFATATWAHMQLFSPAPFRAANNLHTTGDPDIYNDFPHNCCGRTTPMPCRGYLNLLGTPQGAAVASWPSGSQQTWSISGPKPYGSNHYGGSCQVGFSVDKGATFRTTTSYPGNCPHRTGGMGPENQRFPFTVPRDLPAGEQIFAWTWINREQEFFMNCAVVNITAKVPTHLSVKREAITPFGKRPTMLFANVKNGCLSPLTNAELQYPQPGPDVIKGDGEYPLQLPTGNCTGL